MRNGSNGQTYLALDIGAESGRAILGRVRSGILTIEEVHRFANEAVEYGGSLHWDVLRLWLEIQRALKLVEDVKLDGIAVDTWGVDYALLGERGRLLENPYHYRDRRTSGMMDQLFQVVPKSEVYEATGIQFMPINTLYQVFSAKQETPRLLQSAERLITMPDLFHYWLTGNAVCEFTNATTTQMVDPRTRSWATGLLDRLGIRADLPGPIVEPGTVLGNVLPSVAPMLAGTPVIAPASHDTGSAVAAISARGNTAFLSSGTWSLVGIELDEPVVTTEAMRMNFTNEGGVCGTTRLLKNVMGLWMLQGCKKSLAARGVEYEYRELVEIAMKQPAFRHLVDPDDERFLRPECMLTAIDSFCEETGQRKPSSPGAYVRAVLESLALKYRHVIGDLERLTGLRVEQVRKVGGGAKNQLLNQFVADATGKRVLAGPVEATALGNIGMQMLATGATSSLRESRQLIDRSFETQVFESQDSATWDEQVVVFEQYCEMKYA